MRKFVEKLTAKTTRRHSDRRLKQSQIANSRIAAEIFDLFLMQIQHFIDCKKKDFHVDSAFYSAKRRNTSRHSPCTFCRAASNFLRRFGSTGAIIKHLPSVVILSGVSDSIFNKSRIGLSITSARLLPCLVRVFVMLEPQYNVITMYH